jgi:DNA-binding GntR family transcriptional regulator
MINRNGMKDPIPQAQDFQRPRSVSESITIYLREAILNGRMKPDERINEKEISERLNVSRSPIREALRTLAKEELVRITPHKGAVVTGVSETDLRDTYEVREMMELFALDLIERRGVTDFGEMEESLNFDIEDLNQLDFAEYLNQVTKFHLALVRTAGNTKLCQLYEFLHNSLIRYQSLGAAVPGRFEHSVEEHRSILEALSRRSFKETEELLRKHFGTLTSELEGLREGER